VPQYGAAPIASDDAGILRVPSRRVPRDHEDRLMRWGALRRTLHALRDQPYDLVHIHTPFLAHYAGVSFARGAGLPVVETYHTFFEEYVHHYVPLLPRVVGRQLARSITRAQCAQVDALVAPSAPMRDMLASIGVRKPVTVIPTGLPADRFLRGDAARFRAGQAIPTGRALILYVGRVAHEKNIGFLIDSFVEVRRARPEALLVIAGEGPARAALMAQAGRLGLARDVAFVGYLDRGSALADCYAAAAVFVFASRTETQGLVLLEAMAQGCPVVSTAHLGTASILQSGCGARVVPEERSAFARAVVETLADPQSAARAGAQARDYAQRWASKQMAQRMRDFYAAQCAQAKIPQPALTPVVLRETHERRS
jgi:glycosyltransferase involved in cell wall biosynthesis